MNLVSRSQSGFRIDLCSLFKFRAPPATCDCVWLKRHLTSDTASSMPNRIFAGLAAVVSLSLAIATGTRMSTTSSHGVIYLQDSENYLAGDNRFMMFTGPAQRCYSFECYGNRVTRSMEGLAGLLEAHVLHQAVLPW